MRKNLWSEKKLSSEKRLSCERKLFRKKKLSNEKKSSRDVTYVCFCLWLCHVLIFPSVQCHMARTLSLECYHMYQTSLLVFLSFCPDLTLSLFSILDGHPPTFWLAKVRAAKKLNPTQLEARNFNISCNPMQLTSTVQLTSHITVVEVILCSKWHAHTVTVVSRFPSKMLKGPGVAWWPRPTGSWGRQARTILWCIALATAGNNVTWMYMNAKI